MLIIFDRFLYLVAWEQFSFGNFKYVMGYNVSGFFCVDHALKLFYIWGYVSVHFYVKRFHVLGVVFVTNEIATKMTNGLIEREKLKQANLL
jgi:hypothetical protein